MTLLFMTAIVNHAAFVCPGGANPDVLASPSGLPAGAAGADASEAGAPPRPALAAVVDTVRSGAEGAAHGHAQHACTAQVPTTLASGLRHLQVAPCRSAAGSSVLCSLKPYFHIWFHAGTQLGGRVM